jgi:hypothetical protein
MVRAARQMKQSWIWPLQFGLSSKIAEKMR